MDIWQMIEEVNTKEIMGKGICSDDKETRTLERIALSLLADIAGRDEFVYGKSGIRFHTNTRSMYPVFFMPPHDKKKHRLVQGYLPRTNILADNYYELESLRILIRYAPDHPLVKQMTEDTVQRLKNTCFGNSCMKGECLAAGISVLRFLAAARPDDTEWIDKLLTPLGELFESFGGGQAAVQRGIPASYLLMAFTDINNDRTRQLIEKKRSWLTMLLTRSQNAGQSHGDKNSECDVCHLLNQYIIRNALGTCAYAEREQPLVKSMMIPASSMSV